MLGLLPTSWYQGGLYILSVGLEVEDVLEIGSIVGVVGNCSILQKRSTRLSCVAVEDVIYVD
jgi:hypothetical protein